MRTNLNIRAGQIWQSADPRRYHSWFTVIAVTGGEALIHSISGNRFVPITRFRQLGSKGYVRVR